MSWVMSPKARFFVESLEVMQALLPAISGTVFIKVVQMAPKIWISGLQMEGCRQERLHPFYARPTCFSASMGGPSKVPEVTLPR